MEKLIIKNRSGLSMARVLSYVQKVVDGGRVSSNGSQYCNVTTFNNGICVYSDKNKESDKLTVTYRADLDILKQSKKDPKNAD